MHNDDDEDDCTNVSSIVARVDVEMSCLMVEPVEIGMFSSKKIDAIGVQSLIEAVVRSIVMLVMSDTTSNLAE